MNHSRRRTALLARLGNAFDTALLYGMSLAYHEVLAPPPAEYASLREAARVYAAVAEDPVAAQAFLDAARDASAGPFVAQDGTHAIEGGSIVTWRFASRYRPLRRFDPEPEPCPENEIVWVEHWAHDGPPPRGSILALHGFTMGRPRIDAHVLMARRWFRLGYDVALMTLPFHGARAAAGSRYSGEQFASWHAGRLNEAVRQSVHDAGVVLRWLAESRGAPVGVIGMSLGGYVAALLAACHPDLAFVIPVVPAVCLADLPLRLFALSPRGRTGEPPPLSPAELRAAYRVHSPLSHRLVIPRARALVIAALGDGITPAWQARRLWKHWGRPRAIWFSGGHVSPFDRARMAEAIESHLERSSPPALRRLSP
jgi:alpha-beta hydrolase superfamily lysophospholipase